VKAARPVAGIKFNDVIGAAIPVGRAAAKRTRTDDRDLSICPVSKPCIKELRAVLMAVKAETEPAIDQVLY
jgi:hypothetical protein